MEWLNFNENTEIGPHRLLKLMDDLDYTNLNEDLKIQLIKWWTKSPTYDPDVEPEYLVTKLKHLEILGPAYINRIKPRMLCPKKGDFEYEKYKARWLNTNKEKLNLILNQNPEDKNWWFNILFKYSDDNKDFEKTIDDLLKTSTSKFSLSSLATSLDLDLKNILNNTQNINIETTSFNFC